MKQYFSSSEREHEKPEEDGNPARRIGAFTDYIIGFPTQSGRCYLLGALYFRPIANVT